MDFLTIIVGAIASLVTGYLITRYFSHRKVIKYTSERVDFIDTGHSSVPDKIKVTYDGKGVENLVQWKVGIWNGGNQPIEMRDLIEEDPLRIAIDGHRIIDHYAVDPNRPVVNPSFSIIESGEAICSFRILDRGDSFNVVVFSERLADDTDKHGLSLVGAISGIPDGAKAREKPASHTPSEMAAFAGLGIFSFFGAYRLGAELKRSSIVDGMSFSDDLIDLVPSMAAYSDQIYYIAFGLQSIITVTLSVFGIAFWGLFVEGWKSLPRHVAEFFNLESLSVQFGKSLKEVVDKETKPDRKKP